MAVSALKSLVQQKVDETNRKSFDINTKLTRVTGCAEIVEVPGAYLCFPADRSQMNQMFTRIGIYWATVNGFAPGSLIDRENSYLKNMYKIIDGHNLPGGVIEKFFSTVSQNSLPPQFLNPFETEFRDDFVRSTRISSLGGSYYVIAVSAQASQDYRATVSHEVHHARFYLQPALRLAIEDFWNYQVAPNDKMSIRQILGAIYNIQDEQVVIDEFQAYILESGANTQVLAEYAKTYRLKLISFLESRINYSAIEVQ